MSPKVRIVAGLLVIAAIISAEPYGWMLGAVLAVVAVLVAILKRNPEVPPQDTVD